VQPVCSEAQSSLRKEGLENQLAYWTVDHTPNRKCKDAVENCGLIRQPANAQVVALLFCELNLVVNAKTLNSETRNRDARSQ